MIVDLAIRHSDSRRCHRCEWKYDVEDSEFPSRFICDLAYEVREGEVALVGLSPQRVSVSDIRGNRLFAHEFNTSEQAEVGKWLNARLHSQRELIESLFAQVESDRQFRSESTVETYWESVRERIRANGEITTKSSHGKH